ncbi:MAG: type IX secretion system plug protein domain-containing protein [Fulvivirga sp.]
MSYWIITTLIILNQSISTIPVDEIKAVQDKKLVYRDATYEAEIKTVQLYPYTGQPTDVLQPAVAPLNNNNLLLDFDDLVQAPENYRAKIIHCNSDWTPSRLKDLDFLNDYNEFNIDNDELSVDTKIAYVHYRFKIPNVKIPGNYLLVAYRGSNEADIILSKRFILYDKQVSINLMSNLTGATSTNRKNQQLDFKIDYTNYPLQNPMENIAVVIRQNQRWDNAITTLKPSAIQENTSELEYRFFNYENSFKAGNEFRFFDMRSLRYPGQNVQRVDNNTYPATVQLMIDEPRIYQPYTQYDDLNGEFFVANTDTGHGAVQGDYVNTRFTLKMQKVASDVFVIGEMNNWDLSNRMIYNNASGIYQGEIILKQGYYDYQYYIKGDTLRTNYIEGDHFSTENEYDVLIYYTPPTGRADLLIGYGYYEMNPEG